MTLYVILSILPVSAPRLCFLISENRLSHRRTMPSVVDPDRNKINSNPIHVTHSFFSWFRISKSQLVMTRRPKSKCSPNRCPSGYWEKMCCKVVQMFGGCCFFLSLPLFLVIVLCFSIEWDRYLALENVIALFFWWLWVHETLYYYWSVSIFRSLIHFSTGKLFNSWLSRHINATTERRLDSYRLWQRSSEFQQFWVLLSSWVLHSWNQTPCGIPPEERQD